MSSDTERVFDPATPVPISLPLHEALALILLYDQAPNTDRILDENGVVYTYSAAAAIARVLDGMGKACDHEEWRDNAAGLRALLDQVQARP